MATDKGLIWRHDTEDSRIVHTVRRALTFGAVEYHCGKAESGIRTLRSEPPGKIDHGCERCYVSRTA